jgi:anaerobic ribonucleoside-triphosphate reductase activating protein
MNYASIYLDDSKNGNGYRTTLAVSGCDLSPHCEKCFNSIAWDFCFGQPFTEKEKLIILENLKKPYIAGLSIIGGDPISNVKRDDVLLDLVKTIKTELNDKTIYVWTGYTYEEIIQNEKVKEFFKYIDMLRDGRYIPELRDVNQYLQGSKNQRSINVKKSLEKGEIILYAE